MTNVQINRSFASEEAARKFETAYLNEWPREGYGTFLSVIPSQDGSWIVAGSRQASCD
jgi:hypothetical protein